MWQLFLIALVTFVFILIFRIKNNQNYFKKQNIPYLKSIPLLGAFSDCVLGKSAIFDTVSSIYNDSKLKDEPFFGIFLFHKPALFVKDPELIKKILITDFSNFCDRYLNVGDHDSCGYYALFVTENPLWKKLRHSFSSFFTSAKLKNSFYLIEKLGQDLNKFIHKRIESNGKVQLNISEITNLFFVDVITSIAFGVDAHSLENNGSEFQKAAVSVFDYNLWRGLEFTCVFMLPQLTKLFRFKVFSYFTTDFMYKVVPEILKERIRSKHTRNDLIDSLLEIKDDLVPFYKKHSQIDMIIGQIGMFLAAGYETSSTTTTFTLYELSKQPELQQRIRNEIKEVLQRFDGKTTFEMMSSKSELKLLDASINETLRMYPVLSYLDRKCSNSQGYMLNNFKIPFGMPILIPIYPIGRDEKNFPDPLKYDPERFMPENFNNIPSLTHLPFGTGPRGCVGEKLSNIQVKMALVKILMDFRIEANENTPKSINLVKKAVSIKSDKNLYVDFAKDPIY